MGDSIPVGDATVAVSLLNGNTYVFNEATDVEIHPNGWVQLVDEDGLTQYYPEPRVGSIQEQEPGG